MVEGPPNTTEIIKTGPLAGLKVGGCYSVNHGTFIPLSPLMINRDTGRITMARYPDQVTKGMGLQDVLVEIISTTVLIEGKATDAFCVQTLQSHRTPGLRVDHPESLTLSRMPSVYWPCPEHVEDSRTPRRPRFRQLKESYHIIPPRI